MEGQSQRSVHGTVESSAVHTAVGKAAGGASGEVRARAPRGLKATTPNTTASALKAEPGCRARGTPLMTKKKRKA